MAGEVLKKRREDLGMSIKEISELLKIRQDYLSSIEEDRFDKLPVAVYTLGYIRCYASYLKIDPEPIIASYTGNLSLPSSATIIPVASSKKKMPAYFYLIAAVVLLAISSAIFIVRQQRSSTSTPPAKPEVYTAPPRQEIPAEPKAGPPADASGIPPLPQTAERGGEHRITVYADEMTWMKIELSGGRYEEALLRPGTSRSWDFKKTAMLKVGNAGGIRLNFDGKDMGTPGRSGQVITLVFPEGTEEKPLR